MAGQIERSYSFDNTNNLNTSNKSYYIVKIMHLIFINVRITACDILENIPFLMTCKFAFRSDPERCLNNHFSSPAAPAEEETCDGHSHWVIMSR